MSAAKAPVAFISFLGIAPPGRFSISRFGGLTASRDLNFPSFAALLGVLRGLSFLADLAFAAPRSRDVANAGLILVAFSLYWTFFGSTISNWAPVSLLGSTVHFLWSCASARRTSRVGT